MKRPQEFETQDQQAHKRPQEADGRVELTVDDLLPTADVPLPRVDLTTEPEVFIGSDYVEKAYSLLLREYGRMDSSSSRVMPMSFVGFQGAGKTRMLKELSKKLRHEGIPAIFISFGDETEYHLDTEGASTPLFDSLNLRLAWAAATDEARARVARAANVDVDKLNFTMWLRHASISKRTAREWLGYRSCLLLIDDLHRFATLEGGERCKAEGEVGEYLKCNFLNRRDRHFVFTERNNATTVSGDFLSFLDPMFRKWRDLLRPELPLIEEKDLEHLLDSNVTRGTICWAGRSPGLVWEMRQHGGSLEAKVGNVSRVNPSIIFGAIEVLCDFLATAMEGEATFGWSVPDIGNWTALLNVFDEERTSYKRPGRLTRQRTYLVPPCYLAGMCTRLAQWDALKEEAGESFCEGLNAVASSLRMLNHAEEGRQWVGPCAAAVLLRLLQGEIERLTHHGPRDADEVPPQVGNVLPRSLVIPVKYDKQQMGCKFGGYFSSEWRSTEDVVKAFVDRSESPSEGSIWDPRTVFFYQPEPDAAFEDKYDFLVFVVENDGKLSDVWGYKCVRGDALPPGKDEPFIDYKDRRQQWMETEVWPPLVGNPLPGAADLFSDPDMRSMEIKSVWLRGGGGRGEKAFVRRQEDGHAWILPSRDDVDALLGVALNRTCSLVRSSASGMQV
ncbi:unnamed protein product [Vitrella brassicaformis CCMP3155]|uniref:Uncharacterized protein n=1 Tax=Vitrella brassicaformis (strain CCMP3155) TaxID=1169540 RepID=A0A0G4EXZ7_VITBC|nr:unnamed protein product [Vitrella brassicaformis CCMP3155]|eukprot:CEM03596.1 unnamed protein product [Vitrella brassicaformis CCMP3155]